MTGQASYQAEDRSGALLLPVGGGGLASGVGSALKMERPEVRVIAAESEAAQPVAAALEAGHPVEVDYQESFIDGMGARSVLAEMWPLLQRVIDQAVVSSLAEICDAIRRLATERSLIAEGAGASPVAAAIAGRGIEPGSKTVCVISGGNLDPAKLSTILAGGVP